MFTVFETLFRRRTPSLYAIVIAFGITVPGSKPVCTLTVKVTLADPPEAMDANSHCTESADTCIPPFVEVTYENLGSNASAITTFVAADCPLLVIDNVNVIGPGGLGDALSTIKELFVAITVVCTLV